MLPGKREAIAILEAEVKIISTKPNYCRPEIQARKSACRIMEHLSRVEQQEFHLPVDGEGDPLCP
ncbi:hypothetical protein ABIF33_004865 [Bradyrhizobium elkanii]|uniref:hypothetical protein n=1 Tax=Bradyrhizobium elkanii TaxID=29448 RepID=UPI003513C303